MSFDVSVIIPVFNAEKYIAKAIESVLIQPEVKEVLVINDGSTDSSLKILKRFKKEDSRINLLEHKNGENRGRSASRNLGIENASFEFVAFLDADDFYLHGRFRKDQQVFMKNPDADGVYNAIGAEFYNQPQNLERFELTTLKKEVPPERLFYEMWPKGYSGSFSIDGLTVKKNIFEKTGAFNEDLQVAEDTELFIKMSLSTNLYPGEIKIPVSKRGVHESNVIHLVGEGIYLRNYYKMYSNLLIWASRNGKSNQAIDYFWERLHQHHRILYTEEGLLDCLIFWTKTGIEVPGLFRVKRFLKAFPLFYKP